MTNEEVTNEIDCFQVDGDQENVVTAQSMLPDISDFSMLAMELQVSAVGSYMSTVRTRRLPLNPPTA